jgi:hypothetical protein
VEQPVGQPRLAPGGVEWLQAALVGHRTQETQPEQARLRRGLQLAQHRIGLHVGQRRRPAGRAVVVGQLDMHVHRAARRRRMALQQRQQVHQQPGPGGATQMGHHMDRQRLAIAEARLQPLHDAVDRHPHARLLLRQQQAGQTARRPARQARADLRQRRVERAELRQPRLPLGTVGRHGAAQLDARLQQRLQRGAVGLQQQPLRRRRRDALAQHAPSRRIITQRARIGVQQQHVDRWTPAAWPGVDTGGQPQAQRLPDPDAGPPEPENQMVHGR